MSWFFRRVGNLLEWSPADRCLLIALINLVFLLLYNVASLYYFAHTEIAEYVYLPAARLLYQLEVFFILGWVVIVAAALFLRRRSPKNRLLVFATCVYYVIGVGIFSYFFGNFTSLYAGVVAVAAWTFGLFLFERRPVILAGVLFLCIIGGTTLADQLGWIPYSPLLISAPFESGRFSGWFLLTIGIPSAILLLFVLALIDFIIDRWKRHQEKIIAMADELSQANEIISRYVAEQLARKVREGQHDDAAMPSRRRLTMVFSDIVGFSDTADELEPEDLSMLLNEYLAEMTTVAEKYEATIDKFVGDAVICFFGAPTATDDRDQAYRAVRMALEMNERVAELDVSWRKFGASRPLRIRIGVNTGVANVGSFGSQRRMDYTAIGRQVNLAARLEASCEPGSVLISHSTYALVNDKIPCMPKGEINVKGIHQPVKVYSPSPRES
ncbi:MAG: adenylate/guanylate cyclase domain-containing protein [Thermodesulfobacteriota bacterium]